MVLAVREDQPGVVEEPLRDGLAAGGQRLDGVGGPARVHRALQQDRVAVQGAQPQDTQHGVARCQLEQRGLLGARTRAYGVQDEPAGEVPAGPRPLRETAQFGEALTGCGAQHSVARALP